MRFCIVKNKFLRFFITLFILLSVISVLFLILSDFNTDYIGKRVIDNSENSNGHYSVIKYNNHYYARLRPEDGYYVWNTVVVDNVGEIRPSVQTFYEQNYIFNYVDDLEGFFIAVSSNSKYSFNSITQHYYRDDIVFPNIIDENIVSIELISNDEKLFNFDYTMNDCESDFTITDKNTINKILSGLEKYESISLEKETFGCNLECEKSYYIIAKLNSSVPNFCYYVGQIEVLENSFSVSYEKVPFDNGAVLG